MLIWRPKTNVARIDQVKIKVARKYLWIFLLHDIKNKARNRQGKRGKIWRGTRTRVCACARARVGANLPVDHDISIWLFYDTHRPPPCRLDMPLDPPSIKKAILDVPSIAENVDMSKVYMLISNAGPARYRFPGDPVLATVTRNKTSASAS